MQATTNWSFPRRGSWATHKGDYRGNWAPEIPRNLILRYSKKGDVVLDPFIGSGTTAIEAKLLGRRGIGIDLSSDAIKLSKARSSFEFPDSFDPVLKIGDAKKVVAYFGKESVDFVCAHPHYANIISYSDEDESDLSSLSVEEFIKEIGMIAKEFYSVLKQSKFCAVMMGDTRKRGKVVPLGFRTMEKFLEAGFSLKEIIIKEQHNCRATGFWYPQSIKYNFLLLAHEYVFVFEKS